MLANKLVEEGGIKMGSKEIFYAAITEESVKEMGNEDLKDKEEITKPLYANMLEELLTSKSEALDEICRVVVRNFEDWTGYKDPVHNESSYERIITVREALLIELGLNSFPQPNRRYKGDFDYEVCDVEICKIDPASQEYADGKARREELKSNVDELTDPALDKPCKIKFRCNDRGVSGNDTLESLISGVYHKHDCKDISLMWFKSKDGSKLDFSLLKGAWTQEEFFTVEITPRELIRMGIDPEILGLESVRPNKGEVTIGALIKAEQMASFPKKIMEGIKGFFDKLKSKGKDDIQH